MPKRTGLGKGLDALIPAGQSIPSADGGGGITHISVDLIQRNPISVWFPWKPRASFVETGGKGKPVCLKIQRMKPGVYPYGVYHVDTRSKAQGHSSPIIIIER